MSANHTASSMYHRILRVSVLVCAIALVFESGIVAQGTAVLSQNTHSYLANAVGMSVGVAPTPLNEYTAALTAKERELNAREAALSEREISVDLTSGTDSNERATYLLAGILFILLVLILLNYTLDYLRLKESRPMQTV